MKDFLKNKNIILIIEKYTQTKRRISVNISQNSLFSSILYLFYNVNLLKMCENVKLRLKITDFVNDINILTYNKFIKRNYDVLKKHETKFLNKRKNINSSSMNENMN